MLAALIRFSLTQRLLMLVLTVMLIGAGVQAFLGLPIDAFPDVSTTQVKIILKAPGMTPEEVETRLAVPVEQETARHSAPAHAAFDVQVRLTDITIDFEDGTDIYWARQQVGERLAAAMGNLPPGVTAAWRRSPRRWARCSCSPSRAICRWPTSAPCSTG
jgi:cobalt-zinc-cadmium resistance protein CzcA